MRKDTNELFFQLVALMLAIILVHAVYVTVVRPNADSTINRAAEVAAAGGDYVVPRSFFVVIKDFEQEACFILMIWALAIMGYKTRTALRESRMLEMPLVSVSEGTRVLPGELKQRHDSLDALHAHVRCSRFKGSLVYVPFVPLGLSLSSTRIRNR